MINLNYSARTYFVLTILWAVCILAATLLSSGTFQKLHLMQLFSYDKPIHTTLFGVQAWLLIKSLTINNNKNFMKIVFFSCLVCALYGVLTEILQGIFVWLGRGFDYDDIAADAIGCLIVFVWFWIRRKQFAQ